MIIELIENYPCANNEELSKREGYYQKNFPCSNKMIAGRKRKEYCDDNRTRIREINAKWRSTHREEINEKAKKYYRENKEIILAKIHKKRAEQRAEINRKRREEYHQKKLIKMEQLASVST